MVSTASKREHAGPSESGVVDLVAAGGRVRGKGHQTLALLAASRLDDQDGLVARQAPGRGHERARVFDVFEIEHHGARLGVGREVVQQGGEIQVEFLAQGNGHGKPDAALAGPVQHRGEQRGRLADEGDLAGHGVHVRQAGVDAHMRVDQAAASRAEQAHPVLARRTEDGLVQHPVRVRIELPEALGHDHGPACAAAAEMQNPVRYGRGLAADDRQVRGQGQGVHFTVDVQTHDLVQAFVHGNDRADELALQQVPHDHGAGFAGLFAGPDHCNGGGLEDGVEAFQCSHLSRVA
jgi:hypothetical protein